MEQSAGEYRCNSCKLLFKHYKQFLSHKYLNHDKQELQLEINHNGEASQNPLNNFKSSCEMHIGKIPLKKQLKNSERTDSSEDVYNPLFHSRDHESIQSHYGMLTESISMPSCPVSEIEHSQEPRTRCESNPEVTANEPSLSLKYNQAEICRLEGNTGVNRSESSMLPECNQMQIYIQGISEQFNEYQSSTTEYDQMHGHYQQMNVNLPSTPYVTRPMTAINPQIDRDHCALFFEYNPLQFIGCERNQYFNTNHIPMPLGYRQKEFDHYDLYRQSKPNLLSMSHECRESDLSIHGLNPEINANSQDVTDANDNIPLPERNSYPQHRMFKKIDINLQEHSIETRRNLNSVDRSNIIYGEPKTTENYEKRNVICSEVTQNETDDIIFASNSSLKNSNVHLEEASNRRTNYGLLLNNKMDYIHSQFCNENTHKYGSVENKIERNLSPNRYSYVDIGKIPYDSCGFEDRFNQKSDLIIHSAEKTYPWDLCRKTFNEEYNLEKHSEKPYDCDVCGKTFSQKSHFNAHYRIHTGEMPYDCDVCGNRFKRKDTLKAHYRIHSGETPYDCDVCGKKFGKKINLKRHYRIHSGETPYDCDECGKKFSQKGNLKAHYSIHTGKKPHNCDVCGKKFSQKCNLKVHYRSHTGETPYDCDVCGKKFSRKDNLKAHYRIHTGGKS
ncbi:zinc finger protein [Trichonephila inaurata madagascariensis]|uniref:Zinc finger protein n=1 Tax=Trichonephila inaurata madagascariensis TaxID=2747483 RepID=A0A8X6WPS6_9ARAC|nr:zinc finger protein [Trichonephila inaurata madagascariensis]